MINGLKKTSIKIFKNFLELNEIENTTQMK